MSQADLVADFKASLQNVAEVFVAAADADFIRMLNTAAQDLLRVKPRKVYGSVTLVADQRAYALPANFGEFAFDTWGQARLKAWDPRFSGRLPQVMVADVAGAKMLVLDPAPTAAHIADAGATLPFYYYVTHVIDADAANTTIPPVWRSLLLLRAQAEAMREMAMRNITKPVQMVDGHNNQPRNGTPGALYATMLREFERAAGLERAAA